MARSTRKFYRYLYQFEVLSEEPMNDMSLEELSEITTHGHCSGHFLATREEIVSGNVMAKMLHSQGSDPEFFQLDEYGNDLNEEE